MTTKDIEVMARKLRMVSNMINMGEKIRWGQETTLMDEAADMLEKLTQYHEAEVERQIKAERERVAVLCYRFPNSSDLYYHLFNEQMEYPPKHILDLKERLQAITKTDKQ